MPTSDDNVKDTLLKAESENVFDVSCKSNIEAEIQKFGGNSLITISLGGKGVLYEEIVCDVADHVGANYNDKSDIAQKNSIHPVFRRYCRAGIGAILLGEGIGQMVAQRIVFFA